MTMVAQRLLLSLLLLLVASLMEAHALKMDLFSAEYPSTPNGDLMSVVFAKGSAQHCVNVELNRLSTNAAVRFTYDSNASSQFRSPLIITLHIPQTSSLAELESPDSVCQINVLRPEQMEHSATVQLPGDEWPAGTQVVALKPKQFVGEHKTETVEGAYAICFSLDTRETTRRFTTNVQIHRLGLPPHQLRPPVERVVVALLDVSSVEAKHTARRTTSERTRRRRLTKKEEEAEQHAGEADADFEKLLRKLHGVGGEVRLEELISPPDTIVTAADLQRQLHELRQIQQRVFDIKDGVSEQLEYMTGVRRVAERNFTRMWLWAIVVMCISCASVVLVFRFIKRSILARKLL